MSEAPTVAAPVPMPRPPGEATSIGRDMMAALTVTAMAVPQAMAYAQIAELEPKHGLYATIIPTIIAAFIGSSRHLVTGTTNSFCMLSFAIVAPLAAVGSARYFPLILLLALLVGVIQLILGLARTGVIFRYVSYSVVVGFNAAMGCLIAINQIKNVINVGLPEGTIHPLARLWYALSRIGETNLPTVGVALGTVAVILVLKKVAPKLPVYLIAIGAATFSVWALGLGSRGVQTVHGIPRDLGEMLSLPVALGDFAGLGHDLYDLLGGALALAVVGALESVTIASVTARQTGEHVDLNRELLSRGAANVAASFVAGMPVSGSFSRTALNLRAGATSRWSAVFQGVFTAAILLLAAPLAQYVPLAALAGMLLVVSLSMIQPAELARVWRSTRADAVTITLTAAPVVLIDIRYGLLLGVVTSVSWYLYHASQPEITHLYADENGNFHQVEIGEAAEERPGYPVVLILQLVGEMFFGASEELTRAFRRVLEHPVPPRAVILRLKRARHLDATAVIAIAEFQRRLAERGSKLLLCGLSPESKQVLEGSGLAEQIGARYILFTRDDIFGSTLVAVNRAREWVEQNPLPGDGQKPYVPFYQI